MNLKSGITIIFALYLIPSSFGDIKVGVLYGTEQQKYTHGVYWDYFNQVLLFVDKILYEIHRLDTSSYEDQSITLDREPSFVIPTRDYDRRFVINEDSDLIYLFWPYDYEGGSYYAECLITSLDYNCPGNILNDARANAYGAIVTGTTPPSDSNGNYPLHRGSLFHVDTRAPGKAALTTLLSQVSYADDVTWTRDNRLFYFSESYSGCIYSYNYDLFDGAICNCQTVFCFADNNITGIPSGIVIDWNDDLWIAAKGAGLVLNVNPNTGVLMRTVTIPAKFVTDLDFGGQNLDILYVSTQDVGDLTDIHAGAIFQVKGLNVQGLENNYVVMNSDCTPEFLSSN